MASSYDLITINLPHNDSDFKRIIAYGNHAALLPSDTETETFLLPLKNLEGRIIVQIHILEADRTEFLVQNVYSSLSGRRTFLATEGLIPLEKTHSRAQTSLQKRVFLTEIRLSAAKNPKISRPRRDSYAAKNLRKNPLCR